MAESGYETRRRDLEAKQGLDPEALRERFAEGQEALQERFADIDERVRTFVVERPLVAVGAAALTGFVLARLFARK